MEAPAKTARSVRTALLAGAAALLALGCSATEPAPVPVEPRRDLGHSATFPRAAVAADHHAASDAGVRVLRMGGNAVDAAVAASFALSVVRPYSCGIGGGGFMVIHLQDHPRYGARQTAINYRETAPGAVGPHFFESLDDGRASVEGGAAIGVPGTTIGLLYAQRKYGRLERADVLAPAIRLAERGFIVDAHYARSVRALVRRFEDEPGMQRRFPFVWERFLREGRVEEGDLIRVPEKARALRLIAEQGEAAVTSGPVGEAIVDAARRAGGVITLDDLRRYVPSETEPLRAETGSGMMLIGMPPPSSGGIAMLQTLAIMEATGHPPGTALDGPGPLHAMIEAMKHAFADRAEWLADPAFVEVPVERLLAPDYLRERAAMFDPDRTRARDDYGTRAPTTERGGTSHLCVVDDEGNAVSVTETINTVFGSLVAVEPYGFVLNNEMDDFLTRRGTVNVFGLRQSERNLPAPGKRPLSSMSPTILLDRDGSVFALAGASGGPRIISGTLQALLRVVAGESAGEAVDAPRVHHQWVPETLFAEPGALSESDRERLQSMGHEIEAMDEIASVQLIRRARRGLGWEAASDPRKGGRPAGY